LRVLYFLEKNAPTNSLSEMPASRLSTPHHLRFLAAHSHLSHVFGGDWFAKGAESFARFFGTPFFLMAQSAIVVFWIYLNVANYTTFDRYPFILLNLAFSLQAAYAAPLILLAQTRQADRDKAHSEAEAKHREEIAFEMHKEQQLALEQTRQLLSLLDQNNEMTLVVRQLSERIESLTTEIHGKVVI
jgi:uncharacterized membrane protein